VGATLSATSTTTNTIVLDGEGAYEGQTAVLELAAPQPGEFTVAGVIFGGDPPPNPAATTAGQ
jgi:hypothetical protein